MITNSLVRGSLATGKRFLRTLSCLSTPARGLGLLALLVVVLSTAAASRKASRSSSVYTVTATAYEAVASQTDDKPFVTADNSRIPRGYGSHTHWLALSRDLLKPWGGPFEFGDKVRVEGISPALDGVYTVHDTMNRRYRHRLDVLAHPRERISINQPGVRLRRVSSSPRDSRPRQHLRPRRTEQLVAKATPARRRPQPRRKPARALAQQTHPLPARKAAKRATSRPHLATRPARPARAARSATRLALATQPHRAARAARPARTAKRPASLAHQKHGVAKKQLATLPKRSKKRVVAQVHHLPAA